MLIFDPTKARANLRKHGVRFSDCLAVLVDSHGITKEDWSSGEQRFVTLGMDDTGALLVVTWTERHEHTRIISARKASAGETKHYGD